ncbi:DUF6243 family protein [Streptomyces scopuliridis]|uniref:DUF6243 family protein n=1 Tax=Streptomyces scopuliridis TaxID=452529 RepID=UPI002DD8814B|nr:DUF6243 family protein [Streptomyces scopuliridis]WSB35956.1 DUF6243 family protein [Streptomyces scopuliridis]
MAKSRNNLLGVGGQRKKLSRTDPQASAPARDANRKASADHKQELLRKMRERAAGQGEGNGTRQNDATDGTASQD